MAHKMRMQNLTVRKPLGQAGSESSRSPPTGKRDPYLSCLEFMGGNAVKVNDFWLYEVYSVYFQVNISVCCFVLIAWQGLLQDFHRLSFH